MSKLQKKAKFSLFGFTFLIEVTLPKKRKSRQLFPKIQFSSKIAYSLSVLAVVLLGVYLSFRFFFNNQAYATMSTPLLEKVSPALTQISENNIPSPPPKNDEVMFHGPRNKKQIALTFDADMTPEMKQNLLNGSVGSYYDRNTIAILNSTQTKATLFLSGMWIEEYMAEAKELSANSLFELGNHSYSHPSFDGACFGLTPSVDSQDKDEIEKTQKLLKDLGGVENKYFRFPGGCYSKADLEYTKKAGLTVVHWDAAGQDGFNNNRELIENNILENVKNGSIIVLHMNGYPNEPETANALPKIIAQLRERGFEFVKVSELLGIVKIASINIKDFINREYGL